MFVAVKLQVSGSAVKLNCEQSFAGNFASRRSWVLRLPRRRLASISIQCDNTAAPSMSHDFTSSVGLSPPTLYISQGNLTQRYFLLLNVIACTTAVSATWLFCSAIPALLAFKRAAESLEKLLDAVREELPDTMAAVRLSGMEISDLTMELSDLGQKINQGVKSSTRAVHLAEERFHWLANMAPSASMQEVPSLKTKTPEPMLAKSARGIREAIVKIRAIFQMFFTLTRFCRVAFSYFRSRPK